MSLVDCFSFFNELELLDIRLYELAPIVSKFVLVEATMTHQGHPKVLYFDENKSLFKKYNIKHIITDLPHSLADTEEKTWANEEYQRDQIVKGLKGNTFVDTVMISDLDEIPSREVVKKMKVPCRLKQRMSYYYVNTITDEPWWGTAIVPMQYTTQISPSRWRKTIPSTMVIIDDGWHFSYLGGVDRVIQKIESFAHIELNTEEKKDRDRLQQSIAEGMDLYGRTQDRRVFNTIPIDDSFPHLIREGGYKELICDSN